MRALQFSVLFALLTLAGMMAHGDATANTRMQFFAEPIMEGTYEGVNVPTSENFTLAWLSGEPDTPPETVFVEISFGRLISGPELPAGLAVSVYLGRVIDLTGVQPIAQLNLEAGAAEMLAYLIPTGRERFSFSIHDVSPGLIEGGSARLVNVSNETLAAILGNERGIIPPGGTLSTSLADVRQFHLKMRIAAEAEEGWRPVHAARVTARANDRLLVIISRRFGESGPWRIRSIRQ